MTTSEVKLDSAGRPELTRHLRVCWEGTENDKNCGRCEKCIRTCLNFLAAGAEAPECFEHRVTPEEIRGVVARNARQLSELSSVSLWAHSRGATGEWLSALDVAIRRNERRTRVRSLRAQGMARLPQPVARLVRSAKTSLLDRG